MSQRESSLTGQSVITRGSGSVSPTAMARDNVGLEVSPAGVSLLGHTYSRAKEALLPSDVAAYLSGSEKAAYATARAALMIGYPLTGAKWIQIVRAWKAGERALPIWAAPSVAILATSNVAALLTLSRLTARISARIESQSVAEVGNVYELPLQPRPNVGA